MSEGGFVESIEADIVLANAQLGEAVVRLKAALVAAGVHPNTVDAIARGSQLGRGQGGENG